MVGFMARSGPPSKLNDIVSTRREGDVEVPLTAAQVIVERLRFGAWRTEAAKTIRLPRQTLYNWLYAGARARLARLAGHRLTDEQADYLQFLDDVEEAEATSMLTDWTRLGTLAQGGIEQVTIREKVEVEQLPDGSTMERVVERNVTTEHTLPDRQALMWRMERRWPTFFGARVAVEHSGGVEVEHTVTDLRERARLLASELRSFQQRVADGEEVIDLPAIEGNGHDPSGNGHTPPG